MGIWNTTDYKGQPVTWYSAEEIEKYKQALDEIDNLLENLCNHCVVGNNNYCEISECKAFKVKQIIKAVKDE